MALAFAGAVALVGGFPVLSGVDLAVEGGEVVVLRGTNGAGKTSLLKAAAGLLSISSGEAVSLGVDLRSGAADLRKRVGMLGHVDALYDELTVLENARFALRAAKLRADSGTIQPVLERFGLTGRLVRSRARDLSAGQRRRAALAILAARNAELLLLDEPYSSLDELGRGILDQVVAEASARGAAVLLTSHEPEVWPAGAHRVVRMAGGRVLGEERSIGRVALEAAGVA